MIEAQQAERELHDGLSPMDLSSPVYQGMNEYQRFSYEDAWITIDNHLRAGVIDGSHVQGRSLDFGCQQGMVSYVLASHGGDVTIVDRTFFEKIDNIARLGFLSPNQIVRGDGIKLMNKQLEPESLDLITVMMFVSSDSRVPEQQLARRFLKAAERVLKEDGRIVVTSDARSITDFKSQLNDKWNTLFEDDHGLVLSKADPKPSRFDFGSFAGILRRALNSD